ncbi:MAG: hypothetical protein IT379_03215, partial [Deltaproteobacteria bacterium]|nr:hypothetical protein [Deltaproteobacteria bacterium]
MRNAHTIVGAALVVLGIGWMTPSGASARDMVIYVEQSGSTTELRQFVSESLPSVRIVPMRGTRADREAMRLDEGAVAVRVTIVARADSSMATLTVYSRAGWNVVEVPLRRGRIDRGSAGALRTSIDEALQAQGPAPEVQRRPAQAQDDELHGGRRSRARAVAAITAEPTRSPALSGGSGPSTTSEDGVAEPSSPVDETPTARAGATDDESSEPGVDLLAEANTPRDVERPALLSGEAGVDFGLRFATLERPFGTAEDTQMSSGLYAMPTARVLVRPFRGTGAVLLRDLAFGGSYAGSVGLDARNQMTFRTVGMLHQRFEGFVELDPALGSSGSAPRLVLGAGITHEVFEIYDDEPLVPSVEYTGVTGRLGLSIQAFSPRLRLSLVGHATMGLKALSSSTSTSVLWGGTAGATFRILPFLSATAGYRASFASTVTEEGTLGDSYHAFHVG